MIELRKQADEYIKQGDIGGSIRTGVDMSKEAVSIGAAEMRKGWRERDVARIAEAGCLTAIVPPALFVAAAAFGLAAALEKMDNGNQGG